MPKYPTKAQPQAEIAALRHNADLLSTEVASLRAPQAALKAAAPAAPTRAVRPQRVARPVYEFDPAIPGDFRRAAALAKAACGAVRRVSC